jgi:hypothetical protein
MNELRSSLSEYGHPDIIVRVNARWSGLADWLPSYFAEEVRSGVTFAAEQTVQVGWSLLKLVPTSDGNLSAFEPDFEAMPVHWVEGVDRTVRSLAAQRAVCDDFGVEPAFPSMVQPASAPDLIPPSGQLTMVRSEVQGNHSGWTFHGRADAEMRLLSLYEASLLRRSIVPLLALPAGSVVQRNGDVLSVSINGHERSSASSDILARLAMAGAS